MRNRLLISTALVAASLSYATDAAAATWWSSTFENVGNFFTDGSEQKVNDIALEEADLTISGGTQVTVADLASDTDFSVFADKFNTPGTDEKIAVGASGVDEDDLTGAKVLTLGEEGEAKSYVYITTGDNAGKIYAATFDAGTYTMSDALDGSDFSGEDNSLLAVELGIAFGTAGDVTVGEGAALVITGTNGADEDPSSTKVTAANVAVNGGHLTVSDQAVLSNSNALVLDNAGMLTVDNAEIGAVTQNNGRLTANNATIGALTLNGAAAVAAAEEQAKADYLKANYQNIKIADINWEGNVTASDAAAEVKDSEAYKAAQLQDFKASVSEALAAEDAGEKVDEIKGMFTGLDDGLKDINDLEKLQTWWTENQDSISLDNAAEKPDLTDTDEYKQAVLDALIANGTEENGVVQDYIDGDSGFAEAQDTAAANAADAVVAGNTADFSGETTVASVTATQGTVNVNSGKTTVTGTTTLNDQAVLNVASAAELAAEGGVVMAAGSEANVDGTVTGDISSMADTSILNLVGKIAGTVTANAGEINVNGSAAKIETLTASGSNNLNINADTSVTGLFGSDSTAGNLTVAQGVEFVLDSQEYVAESEGMAEVPSIKLEATATTVKGKLTLAEGTTSKAGNVTVEDGGEFDVGLNQHDGNVTLNNNGQLTLAVKSAAESGGIGGSFDVADAAEDGQKNTAKLNVVFAQDADFGEDNAIDISSMMEKFATELEADDEAKSGLELSKNYKYNITNAEGTWTASSKDASEAVNDLVKDGASPVGAAAAVALSSINSDNETAKTLSSYIDNMLQTGNVAAASNAAEDVAPSTAPVVQAVETNVMNQAYGAVAAQLSGSRIAAASEGKASGDGIFNKVSAWVRTLFSKGDVDTSTGFDVETKGVAFGVDKQVSDDVKAGVAYAYGDTEVDAARRDADVKSHTFMLYGEYKPSNWFVNGIASYSMSDYDETKHSAAANVDGSYDVDVYGLQAMAGYEAEVNGFALTPEAGLRYAHIKQDAYTDSLGQRIDAENQDILTAIIGVKTAKDFALENGTVLRPEARLAMTYDLMDGDNSAVVNIGGASYTVDGEELERFGVEAGLGLTAELSDKWDVSAGYEGRFRDDYTDHSGVLSAKYKF